MNIKKLIHRTPRQLLNTLRIRYGKCIQADCRHDPSEIMVFVTNRCNFNCFTCPFKQNSPYSPPDNIPDMSPILLREILNHYSGASVMGIVGGEPLLHPELDTLIRIGADHRMTVNLSTNGSLLTTDRIGRLLDTPLGFLNISLDAATASEYQRVRGGSPELFTRIVENARRFIELRTKVSSPVKLLLSFVTDRHNVMQIPDFARLALDIGADQVFCQTILSYQCSTITSGVGTLKDTPEMQAVLQNLPLPSGISIVLPKLVPISNCRCADCIHPFTSLTLDGAGNLSPCCVIPPHPRYGNFAENIQAWRHGDALKTIRTGILSDADAFSDICLDCWERFSLRVD